jgi:hypothetical protein
MLVDAAAAPRVEDDLLGSPAQPASFSDPLFDEGGIPFAPAAPSSDAMRAAPPAATFEEELFAPSASSPFSTFQPGPLEEPVPYRAPFPGPTARGTLGILVGTTIGALVGIVLSTAMLALYAPTDFAQAILDPVVLWTEIEDWKVLAGAILIAIGFAVLGAGQGAQRRATRA